MLRDNGIKAGRFKVRSLMRDLGLISQQPGSHSYKNATVERPDIPNTLSRAFDVAARNQVWCGDITTIWAQGQWRYLPVVMDLCAHRVVSWAFSPHPDAGLVIRALNMAYEQRGRPFGVMFHSDQGGKYASRNFQKRLGHHRMEQSMSRRGHCWDNAPMERLSRSLKTEWVPSSGYVNAEIAPKDFSHYLMHNYNWLRPHQFNDGTSPAIAEEKF